MNDQGRLDVMDGELQYILVFRTGYSTLIRVNIWYLVVD